MTVQGNKCIGGVNKEHSFGVIGFKSRFHSMNYSFNTRNLSPAHLETARGFLDVLSQYRKHSFGCNPSTVSPMPIGQKPGFLSRAISRQARRDDIDFGSTYEVQILLATRDKKLQSSLVSL